MNDISIRRGWLKAMYLCTCIISGSMGLGMVFFPGLVRTLWRFPAQDPIVFGACGSLFLALGLISLLGLRSPLKYVPVLLLELIYKPIWLIAIALPVFLKGEFPFYVVGMSGVCILFIVGDLIAIPFSYLLGNE